jgi:hypothetical protein
MSLHSRAAAEPKSMLAAETERDLRLFAWADGVLGELGLAERVARASSLDELRKITFDPDAAEVVLPRGAPSRQRDEG